MTTDTLLSSIENWLAIHNNWVSEDGRRHLARQWRAVANSFGVDSGPSRGALLDLVREAWADPDLCTQHDTDRGGDDGWSVRSPLVHGSRTASSGKSSELLALVAALEAAPCRTSLAEAGR